MHKSTGSTVTGVDAIRMTPAAVLNYAFLRVNPERHIDYDSEMGILDMVDEYDRVERLHYNGDATENEEDLVRAYVLSQPRGLKDKMPLQVPYRHLVNVVQLSQDFGVLLEILKRTEDLGGSTVDDLKVLQQRVDCVRYWLNGFAPEVVKFSIADRLPDVELNPEELEFLRNVHVALQETSWNGEAIHNATFEASKLNGIGAKKGFQTLYRIFIERRSGPRMGHFLATLDRDFVLGRIRDAVDKGV
jgi:lysyl-tRNA synthetase class 1